MTSPKPCRILFVCLGNICRSPAGENVMRQLANASSVGALFDIDSAGTSNYHPGKSPDARMMNAAHRRGIPMVGKARQVTTNDFYDFDLILAMDEANFRDLDRIRQPLGDATARLVPFCDFVMNHDHQEVPDPYYGGDEGFDVVLDLMVDGCSEILAQWKKGILV